MKTLNGERSEESVIMDGLEVANETNSTMRESGKYFQKHIQRRICQLVVGASHQNSRKNGYICKKFKEKYVWVSM